MAWYEDPVMFIVVVFAAASLGYLGYRFMKYLLEELVF